MPYRSLSAALAVQKLGLYRRLLCGAGALAATYTCGEHVVAEAEAHAVAKALAEATAIAISEAYVDCITSPGAYACAEAGTHITTTAYAVAKVSCLSFPPANTSYGTSFH
jgi:hypothetical protein